MAVISELRRKYERELEQVLAGEQQCISRQSEDQTGRAILRLDPALSNDERSAKTSHLSMLIQEEERKRESYRVGFLPPSRSSLDSLASSLAG